MQSVKASTGTKRQTLASNAAANINVPMRWSDVVAGRKSTHPDTAPFARILNTTELLEQDLIQLPPIDLLLAQRLCRTIRKAIQTSPMLQTKLGLRAANYKVPESWVIDSKSEALLSGTQAQEYMAKAHGAGESIQTVQPVTINPLIVYRMDDNNATLRTQL
jgi:hypothetical protein